MVLLSNAGSLLVAVLAASTHMAHAIPRPQTEGTSPELTTEQKEGDDCDVLHDRIVCADESSLLFCNQNKWVAFSNCTLGTVCKDGSCVFPESDSDGASDLPGEEESASANKSDVDVAETGVATDVASSAPVDTAVPEASAEPVVTDAEATAEATEATEAETDDTGGDSSGDSSGSTSGDFGITCDKFKEAVTKASSAIGQSYPTPSDKQCTSFLAGMPKGDIASAREAAMFLANILWESDGLQAKEEYDCQDLPDWCAQNYKTPEDAPGKTYWGRGYIQLTWHYNYEAASEGLFGDDRLVESPDQVATDEDLAWGVSFWFWKENVHGDAGVQEGNFGSSINKINGALECNGGTAQDKAKKRYEMYKAILPIFAPGELPKETGCYN
ncbi:hypothetical protein GGH97_001044 [Coemansia sp. RSA 475]|nr:hypothetical protein GGH97_001044 [Coemansia sp. RSA 475]